MAAPPGARRGGRAGAAPCRAGAAARALAGCCLALRPWTTTALRQGLPKALGSSLAGVTTTDNPYDVHLGNAMSFVAYSILKTEQCGQCGNSWFMMPDDPTNRHPFVPHLRALFGLPFFVDSHDAQCEPDIGCSRAEDPSPKEANFPPWDTTKAMFARRLWPLFRMKEQLAKRRAEIGDKDSLVVHLRGGDILPRRDLDYLPAPCKFIDHVIRTGNGGGPFKRVALISDTEDHPCISYVTGRHPSASFSPHTVIEDVLTLMSARNVALSTSSTFGLTGLFLNPNEDVSVFLPTYEGHPLCCEGNYNATRLPELCHIGRGSAIYAIPAPTLGFVPSRRDWVLDDTHFENATAHVCS